MSEKSELREQLADAERQIARLIAEREVTRNPDAAQRAIQEADQRTITARRERDEARAACAVAESAAFVTRQEADRTKKRLTGELDVREAQLQRALSFGGAEPVAVEIARACEARARRTASRQQQRADQLARDLDALHKKHRRVVKGDAAKDRRIGKLTATVQAAERRAARARDVEPGSLLRLQLLTEPGRHGWFKVVNVHVKRGGGDRGEDVASLSLERAASMEESEQAIARAMELPLEILGLGDARRQTFSTPQRYGAPAFAAGFATTGAAMRNSREWEEEIAKLRKVLGVSWAATDLDALRGAVKVCTGAGLAPRTAECEQRVRELEAELAAAKTCVGCGARRSGDEDCSCDARLRRDLDTCRGLLEHARNEAANYADEMGRAQTAEGELEARAVAAERELFKARRDLRHQQSRGRGFTVEVQADEQLRRELAAVRIKADDYRADSDEARRVAVWAYGLVALPVRARELVTWEHVLAQYERAIRDDDGES